MSGIDGGVVSKLGSIASFDDLATSEGADGPASAPSAAPASHAGALSSAKFSGNVLESLVHSQLDGLEPGAATATAEAAPRDEAHWAEQEKWLRTGSYTGDDLLRGYWAAARAEPATADNQRAAELALLKSQDGPLNDMLRLVTAEETAEIAERLVGSEEGIDRIADDLTPENQRAVWQGLSDDGRKQALAGMDAGQRAKLLGNLEPEQRQQAVQAMTKEQLDETAAQYSGGVYDQFRAQPEWATLSPEQRVAILAEAQSNPMFRELASSESTQEAALGILKIAAKAPENAARVFENAGTISEFLQTSKADGGYEGAPERVQEQLRRILADNPELTGDLQHLLSRSSFQGLSPSQRVACLKQIADGSVPSPELPSPPPPGVLGEMASGAWKSMQERANAQSPERAAFTRVELALDVQEFYADRRAAVAKKLGEGMDPDDLTEDEIAYLPPGVQDVVRNPGTTDDDEHAQRILWALLKSEGASDVVRALHRNYSPEEYLGVYRTMCEEHGTFDADDPSEEEMQHMQEVMKGLDPLAAGLFLRGVTEVVSSEMEEKSVVGALLKGVTVGLEAGAESGDDKKKSSVKASVSVSLEPLMSALEQNADNNWARLLRRMVSEHEETRRGGGGWGRHEEDEYGRGVQGGAG